MRFTPGAIFPCLIFLAAFLLAAQALQAQEVRFGPAGSSGSSGEPGGNGNRRDDRASRTGGEYPAEGSPTPDAGKAQVAAAAADARQALRYKVFSAFLTPDLTVRQFLFRTGGADLLLDRIQNAERQGGTRWRGDGAVQLLVELPGEDVADVLGKLAAEHVDRVGAPADELSRGLDDLRGHTFSALGVSIDPRGLRFLRPGEPAGPWRRVTDEQREDALLSAWHNAIARVIESLRPIELAGGRTIGDALERDRLVEELRNWMEGRPVVAPEFRDNLEVRLMVLAPPEEFWPVLRSALMRNGFGPAEDAAAGWDRLRREVLDQIALPVGSGRVIADRAGVERPAERPAPPPAAAERLPRTPPEWVIDQIDVEGTAKPEENDKRNQLQIARAAEADAVAKLRGRIDALPLTERATVGDLARRDPQIEQAIRRTLIRVPAAHVVYGDNGEIRVTVSLLLEQLWRAMMTEQ